MPLLNPESFVIERFTAEERSRARAHFTNLDRSVFALVNLARGRQGGVVRTLLALGQVAATVVPGRVPRSGRRREPGNGRRSVRSGPIRLYEKVFFEYGDDSVAQLGGVHLACETRIEHPDQGARVGSADGLSRAVDALRPVHRPSRLDRLVQVPHSRRSSTAHPLRERYVATRWTLRSRPIARWLEPMQEILHRSASHAGGGSQRRAVYKRTISAPRRSTRYGACCRPRPVPTSASSAPGRPTRCCSCGMRAHPLAEVRDLRRRDAGGAAAR